MRPSCSRGGGAAAATASTASSPTCSERRAAARARRRGGARRSARSCPGGVPRGGAQGRRLPQARGRGARLVRAADRDGATVDWRREPASARPPEGTVRAVDVVDCAPEHERLRSYLLGDVFLCDSLATALRPLGAQPRRAHLRLADGEVVDKEGVVSGGALEGVGDGLLHKRREVQRAGGDGAGAGGGSTSPRARAAARGAGAGRGHAGEAAPPRGARGGACASCGWSATWGGSQDDLGRIAAARPGAAP